MAGRRVEAPKGARAVAHEVLVRVETTQAFADVLLADRLQRTRLEPRDRALLTRLVYGTLAWQGRVDHHLGGLVRMPLSQLDPEVRAALRLALYQLLFLDRVPAYAAVDASVGLARRAGRGAAGLVNAVLRRAAAMGRDGFPLPDPGHDALERLAIEWSHPRWLVQRWSLEVGLEELPRLLAANNIRGPTALRTNLLRTSPEALAAELAAAGVTTSPAGWAEAALLVGRGAGGLRDLPAWREGRFAFQGEAAQLIAPLLDVAPGTRVLDACAAPGGKACHAAEALAGHGMLLALDARAEGVRRIQAEAARLGAGLVRVVAADARRPPLRGPFDAVLVDAPCSGLGTLRRHPELRWRRQPADIPRLAMFQQELLAAVAPLVRPGGVLVYAVCTLTREENGEAVHRFLTAHPRFSIDDITPSVPASLVTAEGFLKTYPHRHGLDGFFATRLRAAV